ncbi:argininosuccinate lyase [Oenococcus kitaharae]|uniref:Argininosuccinate lyase n=1 Tax=Oenococcus kitaharae DSM 17330 TaxID=1045004 RepID=G9WG06_9LACO|nr:argininosuccinate lyase [Oenococcus kitaharae]EHN59584.1 Argininosuccinate lyase [Oenococcus kitaharae DSM 17330]OEY83432.1 argininosuccinate lyase [Oenococcus kitaharae]OEY85231.1 argininosuccinate lyase [Oenococcus kitaharae]OEY86085.1 argininosuccinate lyase [Oenococcus kitaharae]
MKLWGGRFVKSEDPDMTAFDNSLPQGKLMYQEDILGSIAHATMLGKQAIISQSDSDAIVAGLKEILSEIKAGSLKIPDTGFEDIHSFVESVLTEKIGDAGKKLHTARSRNDQVAVDTKMYIKNRLQGVIAEIDLLIQAFIDKGNANPQIMPGYTHLQKAQTVTFKYYLGAYAQMLKRDKKRLLNAIDVMDENPLGSGAIAGTTHEIDRQLTTDLLGFKKPVDNFIDGVSDRDYIIEVLADFSIMAMHLSRLSEELIIFASQEFNYVIFDDSLSTGSSMMPQKKNADSAELVRGSSALIIGQLNQMLILMKGLPLAYNKDMQLDKDTFLPAFDRIEHMLLLMKKIVLTLKLNSKKLTAAVKNGFLNATDMADYLVKKGLPFRDAHGVVGQAVLMAEQAHKKLEDLTLEELQQCSPIIQDDIYEYLDVSQSMTKGIKKEML